MASGSPAPDEIVRSLTALPKALFVGCVSGPLNEEATVLQEKLDPKLLKMRTDITATLELCHSANEPAVGKLCEDVRVLRSEVQAVQDMVSGLLSGTYAPPRGQERVHREPAVVVGRPMDASLGPDNALQASDALLLEL